MNNNTELTRDQQLKLIYRHMHKDYKSRIAGEQYIMVLRGTTTLAPLSSLTDAEIEIKLPSALRKEAESKLKKASA